MVVQIQSYYNSLPGQLKKRFLKRTIAFKESKEFRFHFMQSDEYIPVLISGAAVQLTFGLKHFLIEYFPVINIVRKEYSYSGSDKIVEGHVRVDNHSINISWNNFIQDYEDYSDSQNVGLHELAHAISFDFLYGFHENKHPHYEEGLKEYIQVAAPVFKELREDKPHFLDDYGAMNVEEFWGVSIETFFENPVEFRDKIPGLYEAICELLNQDPTRTEKVVDKGLAGFAI
ncbi:MAG: zinc-dependent peptidase [Chitinophagaceae bacterium]